MKLLRECIRIILEGYKEDQETLINKFRNSKDEIIRMNPKMIGWFIRRFGNNPNVKETHPFEDCIPTVQKYDKKAAGLSQKYLTNEFFKSSVDTKFPEKSWSNPADYINMTVDQMEEIIGLSERKKPRFEIEGNEPDRSDFLGKFGPWNLWMPTTRENSVKIAGYDPKTLDPKTTWCTARVTGSNLFYNYVGRGIILYYIIKDNPQSDTDWLSVGFINGKPQLGDKNDGISVDRVNKELTEETLKSILGGYYEQVILRMQEKTDDADNEHPAKKKIEEAAQSLPAYHNLIKGLGENDARDLNLIIAFMEKVSREVAKVLVDKVDQYDIHKDLKNLAEHAKSTDILTVLSDWNDDDIVERVAGNLNLSVYLIEKLSKHRSTYVREAIAYNIRTPEHILNILEKDPSSKVRRACRRT